MGKLVEKLQSVSQTSGNGMGFLGRARAQARGPRPAAILVTLGLGDSAAAEAALKAGADVIILAGWKPGANIGTLSSAAEAARAVWGVDLTGEGQPTDGIFKAAQEAGACFAVLGPSTPAQVLMEDHEKFDLVVTVDPPKDDLGLVLMRAENLLPAQVALLRTRFTNADLAQLSVADFARLRLMTEGLRFPIVISLHDTPEAAHVKLLVRMGADGLALPAEGVAAEALATRVQSLSEALEKVPADNERSETPMLGHLMEGGGASLVPPAPRREPSPAPEPEPDHE